MSFSMTFVIGFFCKISAKLPQELDIFGINKELPCYSIKVKFNAGEVIKDLVLYKLLSAFFEQLCIFRRRNAHSIIGKKQNKKSKE